MPPCLFLILLLCRSNAACPWPLEETSHNRVLKYFNVTPCALGCGIDPTPALYFTLENQEKLNVQNLVLSFIALTFSLWFTLNLCLQHQQHSTSLWKADLSYQIPFIINVGYLVFIATMLCFPGSILINSNSPSYCNRDEKTLSVQDPANGNIGCTFISLLIFVAIKVIISYTSLLSIVLFRLFWFPLSRKIRGCKLIAHGTIWIVITIQTACIIGLSPIRGDITMRVCLPTLASPSETLWLEIIPIVIFQSVATVLLFSCLYKLSTMWLLQPQESEIIEPLEEENELADRKYVTSLNSNATLFSRFIRLKSKNDSHSKKLRELTFRLLIYNIFQSIFVAILCFNLIFWYDNFHIWESVAYSVIDCQIETYGLPVLRGNDDSNGTLLQSAYDCINLFDNGPPSWAFWFFHVTSLGGAFAGLILTCSKQTIKNYKRTNALLKGKLSCNPRSKKGNKESEMVGMSSDSIAQQIDKTIQYR